MFKKLLISILLSLYLFSLSLSYAVPSVKAASTWYDQDFKEWYSKVYDNSNPTEIFGERYTAAQVQWIIYSLFSFVSNSTGGKEMLNCVFTNEFNKCKELFENLIASNQASKINAFTPPENKGFFSFLLADRPLSGITYIKNVGRNLRLIPQAKAQEGFGFGALEPIKPIWGASRNIVYFFFILITLAMAFMIMFRVKIAPQTVITLQSALPKIVIGLILVTFSYAIAGLLVDLMYVVIGIISLLFSQVASFKIAGKTIGEPGDYFTALTMGPGGLGIFGFIAVYFVLFTFSLFSALFFGQGLIPFLASVITLTAGIFSILGIIATIIMLFILIFIAFKIIWLLIKTFANVLILTIFAPFQIAFGTLVPSMGFNAWLKSYAANLAVFPVVGILFLLAYTFCLMAFISIIENFLPNWISGGVLDWVFGFLGDFLKGTLAGPILAPALSDGWPPLIGISHGGVALIFVAASAVILFMIPKTADIIKSMIEGKPFAYGTAIGEAIGPFVPVGRGGLSLYAGKVEKRGEEAAFAAGRTYIPPAWISALRTVGILKK